MTERLLVAYGLIAILLAAATAIVWWRVYHSHHRSYARDQRRRLKRDTIVSRKENADG